MLPIDIQPSDHPAPDSVRTSVLDAPGFGQHFTDHMVTARWTEDRDWHDARLEPYGPLHLDPATSAFHYAQEFFEGLKAYEQDSGAVVLFRPWMNAARFNRSAARLAMPSMSEDTFLQVLELLVRQDRAWLRGGDANSLYLRPFVIATQAGLGFMAPSRSYLFCAIASPAGLLNGVATHPVAVWLAEDRTRAAVGGTGAVKAACNYAPAFTAHRTAADHGCDQVVWLDAAEHRYVEEMGGMNLFFVYGGERPRLVTPALTGTLLPGVTRDSVLQLAPALGMEVEEGRISVQQWRADCAAGALTEVFACGTAATIIPVGRVRSASSAWTVGDGAAGPVTLAVREELVGIQRGRRPDPFGWVHTVC